MKNIKDNVLQEQTDDNLEFELGMQMSSLGPIPKTKKQAAEVIKRIFNSSKQPFYNVGENISLHTDLNKIKDKIRFFEYGKSFQAEKEGRGFNFEGMLAGLFNGTPIVSKAKEDIIVGGQGYSIKTSEPGSSFDSGTLIYGFRNELADMEENGIDTTDIKTPYDLLKKEGEEYNRFKIGMLTSMFTTSDGKSLDWIFSIVYPTYIEYTVWSSEDLINAIVSNPDMLGVGRSPLNDVRIKSRFVMENPSIIQFPSFTPDELKKLRYVKDRGLKVDKIAELFGKYKTKVRYDVLQYIRKNPQTFLKRIVNLYGDQLGPILKEKGFVELNESIDYNDTDVQDVIIEALLENKPIINEQQDINFETMTPKLWSLVKLSYEISSSLSHLTPGGLDGFQKTLGEFFYINDYEQVVTLWLIIKYNAEYYDIAASEVIQLPVEDVKVPPTIWDIEYYYKGYYEEYTEEEECYDYEGEVSGEDCDCETYEDIEVYDKEHEAYDELPCNEAPTEDRKKAGYADEYDCPCEEFEYKEYSKYSYPTSYARVFSLSQPVAEVDDDFNDLREDDTHVLVEDDERYEDNYDEAQTWDYFHDNEEGEINDMEFTETETSWYLSQLNFKLYNIRESLTEDSDIFGQGLLDPIDPEKFEGDDEEWEELVSDVEDEEFEVEPEYEYTGGKTDPEKGFVAPSSEVTDNICKVEGFCSAQGPITFGQLKALVEEATKKRIGGDIGRGLFKTIWRIVPFFIPQVLLAAVGVTVARAFNKIITPALKDTRGYKSWWGKVVLKAMDVAEGDYIPDVALGDDPISKIFFISDGLLQMIRDKYKLKFARYVADVASVQPDDKPVPEWFVENLLRDYLNQKFLLDPPLAIKRGVTTLKEENKYEPDYSIRRGRQHYAMNVKDSPTESITALNKYLIEKSPFNYMGFDYYLSAVPYDISSTARIDVFAPMLDTGKNADELWSGREVTYYEDINIDDAFSHDEYHGTDYADDPYIKQTQPLHDIGYNHKFGQHYRLLSFLDNHPEQSEFTAGDFINEPGVAYEFSWGKRFNDLKDDMEKLKKLFSLDGIVINRDTSRPWMRHSDSYGNENIRPGKSVPRVVDMKEQTEVEVATTVPEDKPFTKLEVTVLNYLAKEFTKDELQVISSKDWSEIGEKLKTKYMDYLKYFGIDASDGHEDWARGTRFAKWIIDNWDEVERIKEIELGDDYDPSITYNLDFGTITNPIKDWPNMYYVTATESGWEQIYRSGNIEIPAYDEDDAYERAEESWWEYDPDMETDDYGDYESDDFTIDDSSIELSHSLKEHIMSMDDDDPIKIDLEKFGNLLVKAVFSKEGGWGRASQMFILYMTPSGIIKAIKHNSSTTQSSVPFKEEEKVDLASLIRFEKESGFDLRMKGRLRESIKTKRINESINKWADKEFNLVLDHNNLPQFLNKNTQKLNTYSQVNNLVCELWGKDYNYKLNVHNFEVKNIDITNKNYNNLVFENLNNLGVELPLDTLKHYLNKNTKEEIKDSISQDKDIKINKLQNNLVKLGFIKENQVTQRIILEWLNDVIKETNKNGVITEEGKINYVNNIIETSTPIPHGLGVPSEIFFNTVETLKPEVLKDLKPHVKEFMYYCLGFEEMKPDDLEDLYSMDSSDDAPSRHQHSIPDAMPLNVEDLISDSCSDTYNKIWETMRELERKLKNMGILEPRVKMSGKKVIVNYYEDDLPETLVNLYTQIYSEIDERLKSSKMGMPMVDKEVQTSKIYYQGRRPIRANISEDSPRAHSYAGGKHSNPQDVEVRDIIRLIHMDDPQGIPVGSYGEVVGFDNDPWEKRILVTWDLPNGEKRNLPLYPSIDTFMLHKKAAQINEQLSQEDSDKQLTLFPIGNWEFTAHEDENDAKWLEKTVSDDVIKVLFKKWDEEGINLKMFKYLGIPGSGLVASYTIKRYLQNTKVPVQVSYSFDCDDLSRLFDTNNRDYNMDYVKEYLCGDESFWEPEDWYHYEWESYLTDQIDEENWKTISEIFGGVSQSVAEDMLQENSSSEEVDELIEEYQEDIDEIHNFILWANNDETEWATKDAMANDIEDKLAEHFQEEGRLVTDDNGKKSWVIEGDLRDYINDQWDNTETITYSEDYRENVLEDIIMDMSPEYISTDALFGILMREEYSFHEYCEGKRGECLDVETKFFDGYWYPQIDINDSLADRLGELTYEPEITTPEGETIPLQENKNIPHWGLYQLLKKTSNVNNHRRKKVFDFLNVLQNLGLVNMYQSPDFLWSGSKWLTKYLDLKHPELLEEPDEDMPDGRGEIGYDGEWHHNDALKKARYLLDNADTVRDTVLMMLIDSTEDPSSIRVESQMRPFAVDLVKLWAETK